MTIRDALRELGIEDSAPPEVIRRAYLRGVKTRKPETDPEGFRRLREAYELLTGLAGPEPWVKADVRDPNAPSAQEGPQEREEALHDPEAPGDLLMQAEALAARSQAAAAADCALRAIAAAERGLSTPEFNRRVIRLILRLLAAGALVEAETIYDEIEDFFARAGGEAMLISGSTAVMWSLVNEIMRLSDSFPQAMRAALALAAAATDLDSALLDLSRLSRLDRQAAEQAKAEIQHLPLLAAAYGPLFSELTALPDDRAPRGPRRRKVENHLPGVLIVSGLLLTIILISRLPAVLKPASPKPAPPRTLPELRIWIEAVCTPPATGEEERCAWAVEGLGLLERRRCLEADEPVGRLKRSLTGTEWEPQLAGISRELVDAAAHCP